MRSITSVALDPSTASRCPQGRALSAEGVAMDWSLPVSANRVRAATACARSASRFSAARSTRSDGWGFSRRFGKPLFNESSLVGTECTMRRGHLYTIGFDGSTTRTCLVHTAASRYVRKLIGAIRQDEVLV